MLAAIEFDFPIGGTNNRFVGYCLRVAAVRALLTADRARLIRASVDVDHV